MTNAEASNRIVKALAIAQILNELGIGRRKAAKVPVGVGPFWTAVVRATGRDGSLSEATRKQALYFLSKMQSKKGELSGKVVMYIIPF